MAFKKEFEKLLAETSISSESSNEEYCAIWKRINELLHPNIPPQLFRFRTCNLDSLIAFQKGEITTCVAYAFKDKYDSLVYVDKTGLENKIRELLKLETLREALNNESICKLFDKIAGKDFITRLAKELLQCSDEEWGNILGMSDGVIKQILSLIDQNVDNIRSDSFSRIACFTENVKSLRMWDTYTEGYRGFALEYDFRDFHQRGCWTCSNNNICQYEKRNFSHLFPIIYTDKRYDATDNVANLVARSLTSGLDMDGILPIDQLYWYKPYLYKNAESYAHEKEWRLISHCPIHGKEEFANISDCGTLKAIYYGPHIEKRYKDFLSEIAKLKKIQEYDVYIDPYSPDFEPKIKPCQ